MCDVIKQSFQDDAKWREVQLQVPGSATTCGVAFTKRSEVARMKPNITDCLHLGEGCHLYIIYLWLYVGFLASNTP